MIIKYSQVIHSPVVEMKSQTNLGVASDLVIQKSDLTVKAVIIRCGFLKSLTRVAAASDIVEINSGSVILNDDNSLTTVSEALRIKEAVQAKMHGVGQYVRTKSGKTLGRVHDYTIDNATTTIQKLYVKSFFSDRIIPVSAIISFEGQIITVKDDFELISNTDPAFNPETA